MKNKRIYVPFSIFLSILILIASPIEAQSLNRFANKGTIEFGGNISYQHIDLVVQGAKYQTYNIFSFLPYMGYLITDNFEIGVNPIGIQTYWDSQDKITTLNVLLAPAYNFTTVENIYPFVEAQLGYSREILSGSLEEINPSIKGGFSWGGRAGIKFTIKGNGILNMGVQYQQITLNHKDESIRSGSDILMISAGFTIWI